MKITL